MNKVFFSFKEAFSCTLSIPLHYHHHHFHHHYYSKMTVMIAVNKDDDDHNNDDISHTFFMLKPFFSAPLPSTLVTCKFGDPAAVSMRTKLFSVLSISTI